MTSTDQDLQSTTEAGCRILLRKLTVRGHEAVPHAGPLTIDERYRLSELDSISSGLNKLWNDCIEVAHQRDELQLLYLDWSRQRSEYNQAERSSNSLIVERLSIASPMDLTLILGAGYTGVGVYALHMFVRALKNPEAIGSWLPRLRQGWIEGMASVEKATVKRASRATTEFSKKDASRMSHHAERALGPGLSARIETIGISDEPEDLQAAVRQTAR